MRPYLEDPARVASPEPEVLDMIRRLADRLDGAVDPRGDSKDIVSEALIRLALAVHIDAQGAGPTRDRLLTLVLTLTAPKLVH
jgi:hypothetical protein